MNRKAVVKRLGGSDLAQLIDRDFLDEFGLSTPGQYGMVAGDVAAEIETLEGLGCTPFIHVNMAAPRVT